SCPPPPAARRPAGPRRQNLVASSAAGRIRDKTPMKAIVLSAGQGRRLLPLTSQVPKCLLALDGERSVLQLQLETLARCGITEALVVTGFGAERVHAHLAERRTPGIRVATIFNPFYGTSDNLISCWLSRTAMDDDFLLLNGDTVFEDGVLLRLLGSVRCP